jgi:hypothetical protein
MLSGVEFKRPDADQIHCGGGVDEVQADDLDTLVSACERISAGGLRFPATPRVSAAAATFTLSCWLDGPCLDRLALGGARGTDFGSVHVEVPPGTLNMAVAVPLTPAGIDALQVGTTVRVDIVPDHPDSIDRRAGYRVFIRAARSMLGAEPATAGTARSTALPARRPKQG